MGFLIDMINVGEGDSFLLSIEGPAGPLNILIDAGTAENGPTVLQYLNQYAPEGLFMAIVTHLDNDHIGGMPTVLSSARLRQPSWLAINTPPGFANWQS